SSFDGLLVYAGGVIVADLLVDGATGGAGLGGGFQDIAQDELVVALQLGIDAPARLIGGNAVLLHPAAAGVGVEVGARINAVIHGSDVESGLVGGGSTLGKGKGNGKEKQGEKCCQQ